MTNTRTVSTLLFLLAAMPAAGKGEHQDVDPRELVRRAIAVQRNTPYLPRDYVYRYKEVEREFDEAGGATKTKTKTYEVSILYGKQFTRLLERDGKPLSDSEAAKVRNQFDAGVAKRARLSERERAREDAKEHEKTLRESEAMLQIPDLFDFSLLGEEIVNGRQSYVLVARPKSDAHPRGAAATSMAKLSGKLWIDKSELRWVRVEAKVESTVRFGLFLGALSPGSTLLFEQTRVNNEVWLPKRARGRLFARLLVKHYNLEVETTFYDYRHFQSETRLVADPKTP